MTEDRARSRPRVRPAHEDEAEQLSALAIRSKAHWGYDAERMSVFRDELTLTVADVRAGDAHVIEVDARLCGFYTLARSSEGDVELEHLFVDPDALRAGLGATLLAHARERAAQAGFQRMTVQSDPNAAGFYEAMGFQKIGDVASSIPGRSLPCYATELT